MKTLFAPALLVALVSSGCATYGVRVTGYRDGGEGAAPAAGASVFVVENERAANQIFEREVALKIERLLRSKGHTIAPAETADYHLSFEYGVSGSDAVLYAPTVHAPGYGPGDYSYSIAHPPSVTYVPYTRTAYRRRLRLTLFDAARVRNSGEFRQIWVSEATSTGGSDDLRTAVDYLLVAAFKHFGEDTGRQVIVRLAEKSPALQALR